MDNEVRSLMLEVGEIAGRIGDGDVPATRTPHEHDVATLFDRCRGMHGAVVLLLDNGFIQEAAALGRPLFVDSLALAEVAAADETRRIELLAARRLEAFADMKGIFLEMQARGDDDVAKNIAFVDELYRQAETYARRHGAGTRHWRPDGDIKQLADSRGRGKEVIAYRMAHHFVHGSPAITDDRSWLDEEGVAHVGGPTTSYGVYEAPAAMFASYSLAMACLATCEILGYGERTGSTTS